MRIGTGNARPVVIVPVSEVRLVSKLRDLLRVVEEDEKQIIFALETNNMYSSGWLWDLPMLLRTEFAREQPRVQLALECGEERSTGAGVVWAQGDGKPMAVVMQGQFQFRTTVCRAVFCRSGPGHVQVVLVTAKVTTRCDAVELMGTAVGIAHDSRFLRGGATRFKVAAQAGNEKALCAACARGEKYTCLHYKGDG